MTKSRRKRKKWWCETKQIKNAYRILEGNPEKNTNC
jgi:hypothetical protein